MIVPVTTLVNALRTRPILTWLHGICENTCVQSRILSEPNL